ncbi:hypothetical protein ACP70R_009467 [Stipagrostis hirtigluma subsp. patula]
MDVQTTGRSGDKHSVIVVDEDEGHANTTRGTLAKLDFKVMVYRSPIKALNFLKDHEQEVDFVLVAVDMKEMHGFQFLDISRELHINLQVIMMSTDTTWSTMKRCVELGARFLVKKPLDDTNIINNMWQHLDLKLTRMEKIKNLFQGIGGTSPGVNNSSDEVLENSVNKCGNGSKHLMWTPFLQRKFLHALQLLGDAATPKKIEVIMNVNSIDRKQISAHLQKHRKRMEKELNDSMAGAKCSNGAPNSSEPLKACEKGPDTCQYNPEQADDEEKSQDETESFTTGTQGKKVYAAMRRAMQLGTTFEDMQLCNGPSGCEGNIGELNTTGDGNAQDNNTVKFGDTKLISKTHNADNSKKVTNVDDPDNKQANSEDDQTGVVKLVTYSDSEDDEC